MIDFFKKNKYTTMFIAIILIAVFFHFFKATTVPGCINADEAAFGYNAYSILRTGADEHRKFLPLRLQSFNDFKLPLYSYLSIPFIGVFGLNDFSIRFLNRIVGLLFIPLVFGISFELFRKKPIALIAAFLIAVSPWVYVLTRHAHEGALSALFVLGAMYGILLFKRKGNMMYFILGNLSLLLATFSYHTGRIFLIALVGYQVYYFMKLRKAKKYGSNVAVMLGLLLVVFITPFVVDAFYGADRVDNLFFYQTSGFQSQLTEYLAEDSNRLLHNKAIHAIRTVTYNYVDQFSTTFLLWAGDENPRFGMEWLSLMTPIEYLLIFVGLYFMFRKRAEGTWLLLLLIAVAPMGNALTWQENSLTRVYFLIFPLLMIVAYGAYYGIKQLLKNSLYKVFLVAGIGLFLFFLVLSWDTYLNHYFRRALNIRSWQCGYKELVDYVGENYENKDHFYITKKHGQPYIYFLTYMNIEPETYQNAAEISEPDEYGFSQVLSFDKFTFQFPNENPDPGSVIVGYPDDFNDRDIDTSQLEKITVGNEEIFWIYEF